MVGVPHEKVEFSTLQCSNSKRGRSVVKKERERGGGRGEGEKLRMRVDSH